MSGAERTRPFQILLVEDNLGDIRLTEVAMMEESRIPCRLLVARDGVEAIAFLHQEGAFTNAPRPDLILLDWNLPRKNGWEVLEELKADPRFMRIPVVVLTTSKEERDVATAYNLNANAYIVKPVDLDQFIRVIRSINDFWLAIVTLPPK
jgi:CheY-like chemotaxis protein